MQMGLLKKKKRQRPYKDITFYGFLCILTFKVSFKAFFT